jgi:hypothetical protein
MAACGRLSIVVAFVFTSISTLVVALRQAGYVSQQMHVIDWYQILQSSLPRRPAHRFRLDHAPSLGRLSLSQMPQY